MNKYTAILILITSISSCLTGQTSNEQFEEFLKLEVPSNSKESIILLQDFFEAELSNQFNCKPEAVYYELIEHTSKGLPNGYDIEISFDKQRELYQKLDEGFFQSTWRYGVETINPGDISYITLDLKTDNWFMKALLNAQNSKTEDYINTFKNAGQISPSMESLVYQGLDKRDVERPEIQLLLIIHYLTINDNYKRKEKI